jgi:hypothetical protein
VIGSLIMTFVPEFLRITEGVEPIFTGILMILLVLFLPDGLLGLTHLWQRRGKPSEWRFAWLGMNKHTRSKAS